MNNRMNNSRRIFIKTLLIGSGVFLVGKVLGPRVLNLFSSESTVEPTTLKNFQNFRISENKNELIISDQKGNDIFIIDTGK